MRRFFRNLWESLVIIMPILLCIGLLAGYAFWQIEDDDYKDFQEVTSKEWNYTSVDQAKALVRYVDYRANTYEYATTLKRYSDGDVWYFESNTSNDNLGIDIDKNGLKYNNCKYIFQTKLEWKEFYTWYHVYTSKYKDYSLILKKGD